MKNPEQQARQTIDTALTACGWVVQDYEQMNGQRASEADGHPREEYLAQFGDKAAELDALRPDVLRTRIAAAILAYIDDHAWQALERAEQAERESLQLVTRNWDRALLAAGSAQ